MKTIIWCSLKALRDPCCLAVNLLAISLMCVILNIADSAFSVSSAILQYWCCEWIRSCEIRAGKLQLVLMCLECEAKLSLEKFRRSGKTLHTCLDLLNQNAEEFLFLTENKKAICFISMQ